MRLLLVCAVATPLLVASACTFLVSFDDQPSCDGGLCPGDASVGGDDARSDARWPDGLVDDAGDVDRYAPCSGLASGHYCATNQLHDYAGSPDDLVHCVDGGVADTVTCDGGCLKLPNPFPDACNPCVGKADGTYCGRDLSGFPSDDRDFLVHCQGGHASTLVLCKNSCNSNAQPPACF